MGNKPKKQEDTEGKVRPSIAIRMIRHAESQNNQVYRDARFLFRGGTPDFDLDGWNQYVDTHRRADPGLSDTGKDQQQHLADFMVPHLLNQASRPVRVITSPMRRTLETIRPTLEGLQKTNEKDSMCRIIVNGFYHESEGCHVRGKAEEGMSPSEIRGLLNESVRLADDIDFVGFPDADRGWYVNGRGAETREESESRAAKFYLWLCEFLDEELASCESDVFDAGVAVPGEEGECEHDKFGNRVRRRRTALLVGHGDFMSLVLKRIVAGFGHWVENEGVPHRSAFVHFNTGMTELEYFGQGRFLIMGQNQTPHIRQADFSSLRTGGSLKDGWSYLMPNDSFLLDAEVSVAFSDEEIEDHVKEQTEALKSLYLPSRVEKKKGNLDVEEVAANGTTNKSKVTFVVKRGLQVVACADYNDQSGQLSEVVMRPSARRSQVGGALVDAVRRHARGLGRSNSLRIKPTTTTGKDFLESLGFQETNDDEELELGLDS